MIEQLELEFDESVTTNVTECLPVGVYRDMLFADYAKMRAFNSGVIKWGGVSQLHMHAAYNGEISNEDTQSRKFGRAVHTRLLEPKEYAERVLVSKPCSAKLKTGERKDQPCGKSGSCVDESLNWFCGAHKPTPFSVPTEYVSQDEHERIEKMAAALHDHPAMALLKAVGWSECSIVYEFNGMTIKGRIDRYSKESGFILDVKKCRVGYGTMELCRKAIAEYAYMRQMAIYRKGIETLEGITPRCVWLFIEDGPPYAPQIVEAEDWELDHAWQHVAGILSGYKHCSEIGRFDAYVKLDQEGKIISQHRGGYPAWMAEKIKEGKL